MTEEFTPQDARALLRETVKGQDDAALLEMAQNLGGIESFLDLTFEGMKDALDPDRAQDAVIGWELRHGDETYRYVVTIRDRQASWAKGDTANTRVTLNMAIPTYIRIVAGELDGMQAFMQGGIQLKGDMMFAAQVQQLFTA